MLYNSIWLCCHSVRIASFCKSMQNQQLIAVCPGMIGVATVSPVKYSSISPADIGLDETERGEVDRARTVIGSSLQNYF